tara:strand:- start:1124 stop:1399 length:276 start_codon:yes stop_codon:yes gene_type:complete
VALTAEEAIEHYKTLVGQKGSLSTVTTDNIYMSVRRYGFKPVICDGVFPDGYKGLKRQGNSRKYQALLNSRNVRNIEKKEETMNSFDVSFV